jgi:energy-coupling factor transporter transmembrane protein EcfT
MVSKMDLAAEGTIPTLIGGATFVAMMNFVPDYVSLIETRFVVRRIAASNATWKRALWLVSDAALTFFTLFAFMFLFTFLGWSLEGGVETALREYPSFVKDFWWAIGPESQHPVQLCFYSTFSTSLIVWLFGLGSFALRNLAGHAPRRRWLHGLFSGGRPVRAIGATAALIAFLSVLVLCFWVAPGQHWMVV